LQGVNLEGLNLKECDLHEVNIANTQFVEANLQGADLRGVLGINCDKLDGAKNLATAYRDVDFGCGAAIPEPPKSDKETRKHK
jgi:uncharacterized protein YjbI with pentapeptide repeats